MSTFTLEEEEQFHYDCDGWDELQTPYRYMRCLVVIVTEVLSLVLPASLVAAILSLNIQSSQLSTL